ncbi:MAG: pyridoxamine 5'-phosphate oxidase [Bacteroidetes bacterium B1(2017)]|nr:MAG: pyridoxamine 5'-phosphate oxidase [Bacteroidetes bacterium B1(2017)]
MISNKTIASIRQDYTLKQFDESHLVSDPMEQFKVWFKEAVDAEVMEPNAMTLATTKYDGKPTARVVLLKALEPKGFVFFTNYDSNKGKQIHRNPYGALVFFWPELQRQVRIEGIIVKNTEADSDEYFYSRPIESQIGAHASPQSSPIESRTELEENYKRLQEIFKTEPLIRPRHWGGFVLEPTLYEFWQGRSSRLHDRFQFSQNEEGKWLSVRLAP